MSETCAAADPVQQRLYSTSCSPLALLKHCLYSSRCRAALLLLILWCSSSSSSALAPPEELVSCLKNGQHNQLTSYQDFVDGKPTRYGKIQQSS